MLVILTVPDKYKMWPETHYNFTYIYEHSEYTMHVSFKKRYSANDAKKKCKSTTQNIGYLFQSAITLMIDFLNAAPCNIWSWQLYVSTCNACMFLF